MPGVNAQLRTWLKAGWQAATLLGLALLVFTWTAVELYLRSERANVEQAALVNLQNLARAFEAHVIRSIREIDKTLLILRTAYERDPAHFDFKIWLVDSSFSGDLTWHFSIANAEGILTHSSGFPITRRIDVSQFDHVRAHMESFQDRMLISTPSIGQTSRQWSVQLTRRIRGAGNSFDGVISAAINPLHFSHFYESIDVGRNGSIVLAGFDGVVRAAAGRRTVAIGDSIIGTATFQRFRKEPAGAHSGHGITDGVRRLMAYRVVEDYPLIVIVGAAREDVFAAFHRKELWYRMLAAGVSLLILFVVVAAGRSRLVLERTREALSVQFGRFHAALNNMSQGLCMFDAERRVTVCNTRFLEIYGLAPDDAKPGTPLTDIVDRRFAGEFHGGDVRAQRRRERLLHPISETDREIIHFDDGRAISFTRQPIPGGGWVSTHEDITERERIEAKIVHMASHDALTDLANRLLLHERLDGALDRLAQTGTGFAVLSVDLDRFKFVNDTMGHPVGDRLLREVASRLRQCAAAGDTIARLGGDEFAILQAGGDAASAAVLAERIHAAICRPCRFDGGEVTVSVSIGIALSPRDGSEADQLFKSADIALYRAKSEGRNKTMFFESEMNALMVERREIEVALRHALAENEFEVHFQPIFALSDDDVIGCEALLRWRRPGHGMVLPGDFIPIAEESGLIAPIGEWVLRYACAEAAGWACDARIAVNLSPNQFTNGDIAAVVTNALAVTGLAPERLELEITETVLLLETEANLEALHRLRRLGVRIAFDDFGTGYSSLGYLTAFPFDTIKIDRRFTKDIASHAGCRAIVDAVVGIGEDLGIETVIEGVETDEQLAIVRTAGCTHVQGFLLGRPQPAADMAALLANAQRAREQAA
jgi:diguanylate cyclase (GGDEF)-like protein/PAS domain S-box-containing protein